MNINQEFEIEIHSPGRINLIGEHVDYNGGHVLPASIDKKIVLKFRKREDKTAVVYSKNIDSGFSVDLTKLEKSNNQWHNYVLGVIYHIEQLKPNSVKGFDCYLDSNIPLGSGVSSSAALECGIAKGLDQLFNIGLTDVEIVTLSRDAEHTFVGTKCGIMDQFAVVKGKDNHLLLLNCETLEHNLIPADFGDYRLLLLNTNVSHNLASSEYNVRREECDTAMEVIQKQYPEYNFLCNMQPEVIKEFVSSLPAKVYDRALYASQENQRTLKAVEALKGKNIKEFGKLMYASHEGLSTLYEVSCKELDFLVDYTKNLNYVLGSRMMGGGFGGCTINLLHKDQLDNFINEISNAYHKEFEVNLTPIAVNISDGVLKV